MKETGKCVCELLLQLANLERKWQHLEQNNFVMKECILQKADSFTSVWGFSPFELWDSTHKRIISGPPPQSCATFDSEPVNRSVHRCEIFDQLIKQMSNIVILLGGKTFSYYCLCLQAIFSVNNSFSYCVSKFLVFTLNLT